jgi:hypothetical protein
MSDVRIDEIVDMGEVAFLLAVAMDEQWLSSHACGREPRHNRVISGSLIAAGYPQLSWNHPTGILALSLVPVEDGSVTVSVGVAWWWWWCGSFLGSNG